LEETEGLIRLIHEVPMKTARSRNVLLVLTGLIITAINVRASDPVGVYAIVDRVVLEPNDTSPERIQIWGTFSLWEQYGDVYGKPTKGYLYYKFATNSNGGKVERAEWSDLKAVAGTQQGIAFGQRHSPAGRIRPTAEKPSSPDPYPLGVGLTKVGIGGYQDNMKRVIADIKKTEAKK
jgi:hypothetical protein